MSDIGISMRKKGYIPLSDDGYGGIGIRPSLKSPDKWLKEAVWFDTGQRMKDLNGNSIPITVSATSESRYSEYLRRGWRPVLPEGLKHDIEGAIQSAGKSQKKERTRKGGRK